LRRRGSPRFFVADADGGLLVCSPDLEADVLERAKRKLGELIARNQPPLSMAFEPLDPDTILRFVPLSRDGSCHYAVFIERIKREGTLEAAKRFGLTKREAQVLDALMAGLSNPAIAERLCIAEATVGEHVKKLFKKTQTNKRSELVARMFQGASHAGRPSVASLKGDIRRPGGR
jgi:DNA-binding CsgD family transcriptional regulator